MRDDEETPDYNAAPAAAAGVTLIFLRVPTRMIMLMHARARGEIDGIYRVPVRIFAEGTGIERVV